MKAIVSDRYGQLELGEIDRPTVGPEGMLVRVTAASVNPADYHLLRGRPYLMRAMTGLRRPKQRVPGIDAAGVVEAVGENVTEFEPGDEVFGARNGSFAEFVYSEKRNFVRKPTELTFPQAAAIPVAGVTALQALRDKGRIASGQRVLINGASGGVGTFAVQIAKAYGAHVTGVCSTRNVDMVRSLGADEVIDYTTGDYTRNGQRYDLIVDNVGNHALSDHRRALTRDGTLVGVGAMGRSEDRAVLGLLGTLVASRFVSQRIVAILAKITKDDLNVLRELVEEGKLTPVIDRTYPLSETPEAIRYVEGEHARGKVVITVR